MEEGNQLKYYEVLVIGGSAGSLDVLIHLLPAIRKDLGLAIIIVLHRKGGVSILAELLGGRSSWPVKEAEDKEPVTGNCIYLAPADYHLLLESNKTFSLDASEKLHYSRPAIDVTFETAADVYLDHTAALLLSGANADGAAGLKKVKEAGGLTLVQDPEEAIAAYMPNSAIRLGEIDHIAGTVELVKIINALNCPRT